MEFQLIRLDVKDLDHRASAEVNILIHSSSMQNLSKEVNHHFRPTSTLEKQQWNFVHLWSTIRNFCLEGTRQPWALWTAGSASGEPFGSCPVKATYHLVLLVPHDIL